MVSNGLPYKAKDQSCQPDWVLRIIPRKRKAQAAVPLEQSWIEPGVLCHARLLRNPVGKQRVKTPRRIWIPARVLGWSRASPGKVWIAVYPHQTDQRSMQDGKPRLYLIEVKWLRTVPYYVFKLPELSQDEAWIQRWVQNP